jgi:peptidoglycan/LPS O-acetylase OafA/YrhL
MENGNTISRVISLDLLRILAVFSVLGVHQFWRYIEIFCDYLDELRLTPIKFLINSFFMFGLTGVCIFFFVSGYAITLASLKESSKTFAVRRFFRIYPLYVFVSLLELVIIYITQKENVNLLQLVKHAILNVLMVGDFMSVTPNISGVA